MEHIKTFFKGWSGSLSEDQKCGECQTSCQSACKTSCTVGNQACDKKKR